jgi:hypothetical protein
MKDRIEASFKSAMWRRSVRSELLWLQEELDYVISQDALPSVVKWEPRVPESVQAALPMLGFVEHCVQIEFLEKCSNRTLRLEQAIRDEVALMARQATRSVLKNKQEVAEARDPALQMPAEYSRALYALGMIARRLHQSTSREEAYIGCVLCTSFKQIRRPKKNKLKIMVSRGTPAAEGCLVDDLGVAWKGILAVDTTSGEYWANKAVLDAGLLCARVLLQETGDVNWTDIKANLPKFRQFTASQTRFCRQYLKGVLLRDYIIIEDDEEDDDDCVQAKVERGAIRAMDLFVLASASKYLTPIYGSGESVMYTVKSSMTATQTLQVYEDLQAEQSPAHRIADDFLILKMHKKPSSWQWATSSPGMGHFKLAVLHVGSKEIVFTHDGLVNEGLPDLDHVAVQAYDIANKSSEYHVAEVRPVTPSMMAGHGVNTKEEAFAKLAHCSKFRLEWTSFTSLHRIPPMMHPMSFPTCSFDTCVMEDRCVEELTGHCVIQLPEAMGFGRFELDRTVQSDR